MSKKETYIGVDIGTSSIKVIELHNDNGRAVLATYGFTEEIPHDIRSSTKEDIAKTAAILKKICESSKISSKQAIAALPTFSVFTSLISLPAMSKDELDAAVKWEAKKIIPLPLEEIVLDYKILNQEKESGFSLFGKKDENKKDFKILLTGAAKDLIRKFTDIFNQAGLTLNSLETESFALTRSLIGADMAPIMMLEIGATTTDIVVVNQGVPFLTRSIDIGGKVLTNAIMNSLNINERRAEQLKRDIGIIELGEQSQGVPRILESALEPVIHEIKYTLELVRGQSIDLGFGGQDSPANEIEKIVLTGGSAMLPNLASYINKQLNIRCYVGDPWSRIAYPEDLKPVLAGIGPKFSVSIGLALREILT